MSVSEGVDVVARVQERIRQRIDALEPLVAEERMLRIVLAVIEARLPASAVPPRTRAQQALAAIAQAPGARPVEIAAHVGIDVIKVYAALRTLEQRGHAHRSGRGWFLGPSARAIDAVMRGEEPG